MWLLSVLALLIGAFSGGVLAQTPPKKPVTLVHSSYMPSTIAGAMVEDVRKDLPKLQKGVEEMGRRLDKYLEEFQKVSR